MKKITAPLLILLTILTVPIQSGKAEIVSNVSEYSEAEKETLSTDEPKKTQEEEIEQEIINEENNSEEETNKDIEDVPTETDDNEASFQNESNEPASEKEVIKEEQMDIEENQSQSESNTEIMFHNYPVENQKEEDIEDNKEDSSDVTNEEVEKEDNEAETNISEPSDKSNEFSITQSVDQSIYENDSLEVPRTSQTNETISLSLVFKGEPTIDKGVVYINFKFPDSIELSEENIMGISASYYVSEELTSLFGMIRLDPRVQQGDYERNQIRVNGNQISLRFGITDPSRLGGLLIDKIGANHTFTLNIALRNRAFSLEGENEYTFQAIGTQVENPISVNQNEIREAKVDLDISETGGLALKSVPAILQFQTIEIGSDSYVPLVENLNHMVEINDTRIFNENWTLTAQSIEPFTSSNSEPAPLRIGILEENNTFRSLNEALIIAESSDNQPSLLEIDLNDLNNREIGVFIDNFNLISNETYSTTIEWTLSDAP